jgi:hypothetical protein
MHIILKMRVAENNLHFSIRLLIPFSRLMSERSDYEVYTKSHHLTPLLYSLLA